MGVSIGQLLQGKRVVLNERSVIKGDKSLPNRVQVLLGDGSPAEVEFAGVIDRESAQCHKLVKVINIRCLWWNDTATGAPYHIPEGDITIGAFFNDKCYLAINSDDTPWHYDPDNAAGKKR